MMYPPPKFMAVWLGLLIISGCSNAPQRELPTTLEQIESDMQARAEADKTLPPVPEQISAALLPPLDDGLSKVDAELLEQRFDITVSRTPAREFFMSLVEGTPYNMVVHPDVSGEISLTLKDVSIPDIMETVREVYGYEFRKGPNGFLVMPISLQSRLFQISYLNISRDGSSRTRISSGQVSESGNSDNASSGGATSSGGSEGSGISESVSGSEIRTVSQSDFWQDLNNALNLIVGREDGRQVVVNPQSGVVLIKAMPSELREVELYLDATQINVQRQVIVEAKILEVTLSDGFQSGIDWSIIGEPKDGKTITISQAGAALAPSTTFGGGGVFSLALALNDFNATINLLETQGNVQVLSSPRVSTVNNQKAVIKVGSDEFFVTNVSRSTDSDTNENNQSIELTPFFSGIALDVTPQIDPEGNVTLHIHPSVSEVTERTKNITIDNQTQSLPLAFSNVRESDSIVRAANGQVVVIGGLMSNRTSEQLAETPMLGDIPFVGSLFRQNQQVSSKSELVILLRPVVVDGGNWPKTAIDTGERFRRLKRGFHYGARPEVFGVDAENNLRR